MSSKRRSSRLCLPHYQCSDELGRCSSPQPPCNTQDRLLLARHQTTQHPTTQPVDSLVGNNNDTSETLGFPFLSEKEAQCLHSHLVESLQMEIHSLFGNLNLSNKMDGVEKRVASSGLPSGCLDGHNVEVQNPRKRKLPWSDEDEKEPRTPKHSTSRQRTFAFDS
eukprot:Platyproteum_vivax@DN3560_c0_g1_i1.p1